MTCKHLVVLIILSINLYHDIYYSCYGDYLCVLKARNATLQTLQLEDRMYFYWFSISFGMLLKYKHFHSFENA